LSIGVALLVVVTAVLVLGFGRVALIPSVTFGALALVIELVSVRVLRPVLDRPFPEIMKRRGVGMVLRGCGIACFVIAVAVRRDVFPPLPTAFGLLGVLIPLLLLEPRFLK
jgi:hypothetical protein